MAELPGMSLARGPEHPPRRSRRHGDRRFIAIAALAVAGGLLVWWLFAGADGYLAASAGSARGAALVPGSPAHPSMRQAGPAAPRLPGLDVMAAKLASRLEQEPADREGWILLARTYRELGDAARADAAYARAAALRPGGVGMPTEMPAAGPVLPATHP